MTGQNFTSAQEGVQDYEVLLHRCANKAYNFALRLTGNDPDAQDLVQEAFSRAFEHKDKYDSSRPFEAWLIRILHNVFLDGVRRYEHKHKVSLDAPPPTEEGHWEDIIPSKEREPLEILVRDERQSLVQRALNAVEMPYRSALILYDIEGLSYDEISKIMKCPIGTVCSRIHKGRVLLKKAFESLENKVVK